MLTVAETERYLQRIGYAGGITPGLENLKALMLCQLKSIPYETVRLHRTGAVPDLSMETLYRLMIEEGKGGYCFELNKLFFDLLLALGYKVRPAFARSIDTPGQTDPINHRASIVALGQDEYLVDVGWGGPAPAGPLLLSDVGVQEVRGKQFIVSPHRPQGNVAERAHVSQWKVERISSPALGSQRLGMMILYAGDAEEPDFEVLNLYCSQPGMEFRDTEIVNLTTDEGYVSLTGNKLTIASGDEKQVKELSPAEVDAALKQHFGLHYPSAS